MRVAVIGGSIAGLATALFFGRAGHDVVVIESDASEPPEKFGPDTFWTRGGTPHARQAHAFLALFVKTLRERAPDVIDALLAAGAVERGVQELRPSFDQPPSALDQELSVIASRRPLVEWILRSAVLRETRVDFRSGVRGEGLEARVLDAVPHVTGVLTDKGRIAADVVVDASGRTTQLDRWLEALGAPAPGFLMEPANQLYFTRHYRLHRLTDLPPINMRFVSVSEFPSFSVLMFPGDSGICQVAISTLPEDADLKKVRRPEVFQTIAAMAPAVAPWVDPALSEPVTFVGAMGGLNNYIRRMTRDGKPVLTGLHLVGDSASITNPAYGRGVSHAVGHAAAVFDVVASAPDDPREQVEAIDAEVVRMLVPSYKNAVAGDRSRSARWRAAYAGDPLPPPPIVGGVPAGKFFAATFADPELWTRSMRSGLLLDPPGAWLDDQAAVERVAQVSSSLTDPPQAALPTKRNILEAINAVR